MEATFFFRETTVKSSPSVSVRSPMPSALTTRALARITGRLRVVGLHPSCSRRPSYPLPPSKTRVSINGGRRGCCVAGSLSLAGALFFPGTCLEQEKSCWRFCVPLFAFEGEGIVGNL
ncbi:hypothetical protein TNCV_4000031 [Trichonephila clavipes]|nr:hypothetical protein TNCV_4000031 [Trichonephila clavipes]